jgi:hypothetical protein
MTRERAKTRAREGDRFKKARERLIVLSRPISLSCSSSLLLLSAFSSLLLISMQGSKRDQVRSPRGHVLLVVDGRGLEREEAGVERERGEEKLGLFFLFSKSAGALTADFEKKNDERARESDSHSRFLSTSSRSPPPLSRFLTPPTLGDAGENASSLFFSALRRERERQAARGEKRGRRRERARG